MQKLIKQRIKLLFQISFSMLFLLYFLFSLDVYIGNTKSTKTGNLSRRNVKKIQTICSNNQHTIFIEHGYTLGTSSFKLFLVWYKDREFRIYKNCLSVRINFDCLWRTTLYHLILYFCTKTFYFLYFSEWVIKFQRVLCSYKMFISVCIPPSIRTLIVAFVKKNIVHHFYLFSFTFDNIMQLNCSTNYQLK